jgi:hypothetical protein
MLCYDAEEEEAAGTMQEMARRWITKQKGRWIDDGLWMRRKRKKEGEEGKQERVGGIASLMLADGNVGSRMRWQSPLGRASMPRAEAGKGPVEPCRSPWTTCRNGAGGLEGDGRGISGARAAAVTNHGQLGALIRPRAVRRAGFCSICCRPQ